MNPVTEYIIDTILKFINICIEFSKLLISWPVAFLIVMLILLLKYRKTISKYLENATFKGPNWEVSPQQKSPPQKEKVGIDEKKIEESQEILDSSGDTMTLRKEDADLISSTIRNYSDRSVYYEFMYLNNFFVHSTKSILKWFYDSGLTTRENYYSHWIKNKISNDQLDTIFFILLESELIEYEIEKQLFITQKGIAFLKFIRFI